MNPSRKRNVIRLLQVAVSVGMLLIIFQAVNLKAVIPVLFVADYRHFFIALLLALAQFVIGAWRWQQLIYLTNGINISWNLLFNSYLSAFFVNNLLPGTITGDIVRISDTRNQIGGSAKAASIVFMERLLGLIFLFILSALSWLNVTNLPKINFALPNWFLPALATSTLVLFLLWVVGRNKWGGLIKVQQWLRLMIMTILQIPGLLIQQPKGLVKVLIGTITFQLLSLLIVYEALLVTEVSISLWLFMAVAPIATLVLMLPISVQGVGVRESLYLSLLVPFGASPEALLAGLALTYLIGLPFSLWGWMLYHHKAKLALQNI
jgi:uncharacterized membrane protein YbhN (UPF0104 family)